MDNEIKQVKNELPEEYVYDTYRVVRSNDPNLHIPYKDVLNKILEIVNVKDILDNVQVGTEYVVQIPEQFDKQFQSGEFWIMENSKTGKLWPTLMKKGDDGKNKIVTPLGIKKESFVQGNPIQEMTQQFQMAQVQGTLKSQTELLESICKSVKHIQKGQMNDRIALLESGKKQIYLALKRSDDDPGKRIAIENGIHDLINAQDKIYEELRLQINEYGVIPKSQVLQFFEGLIHMDYWNKKSEEYNEIVDLFNLYKESTKYIAVAYLLIEQPQVIESIYSESVNKLKELDYSSVMSIEHMYSGDDYDFIFNNDIQLLEEDKKECLELNTKCEGLAIEVSGEQLLEAINHGKETNESESKEA